MERPLLIVGLDPGTTAGYAFCDLTGKVIGQGSLRGLDLDGLVAAASNAGQPVIVGCDKAKVPGLVASFAAKFGARIVSPPEDLRIIEKQALAAGLGAANSHERDALASAAFAFQHAERLLGRISRTLHETNKESLLRQVQELVLKRGMSIAGAIELLERPAAPEVRAVVQAVNGRQPGKDDLVALHNELHALRGQNRLLRGRLERLESALRNFRQKHAELKERGSRPPPSTERLRRQHGRRIEALALARLQAERERGKATRDVARMRRMLITSRGKTVLKRLATLGWDELARKEPALALGAGDILLVDDPGSYSERALERLQKLGITTLVTRGRPGRTVTGLFHTIPAERLRLDEEEHLALVDGKELEREMQPGVLARVVEEYQRERKAAMPRP